MSDAIINITYFDSPAGKLALGDYNNTLCMCDWVNRQQPDKIFNRIQKQLKASYYEAHTHLHDQAIEQLTRYFNGQLTQFDLPLLPIGTAFQLAVWAQLNRVAYGQSESYKAVAEGMGRPLSVRAVANAIGANALSLVIPCHRIVGSNGAITGYAGGLPAKSYLLALESKGTSTNQSM